MKEDINYLSVIGSSFLEPIAALFERLETMESRGPNPVQTSPKENGYAASLIVLSVVMLESLLGKTWYMKRQLLKKPDEAKTDTQSGKFNALKFIQAEYPHFGEVMFEVFVIRDVIAHGHLWEASVIDDDELGLDLIAADLSEGYGDRKLVQAIDRGSRLTRHLRLNIFPTRIHKADAFTVLARIVDLLEYIENEDRRFVYLSPQVFKYRGQVVEFAQFRSLIRKA